MNKFVQISRQATPLMFLGDLQGLIMSCTQRLFNLSRPMYVIKQGDCAQISLVHDGYPRTTQAYIPEGCESGITNG